MNRETTLAAKEKASKKAKYPAWAPRFWHGMLWRDWWRLLARHHFRVHPWRWGLATTVSIQTAFNSVLAALTRWRYRRQVAQTALVGPPVFIVGHWRSGTTYLHELLSCDERFATPTTFQCFAANHFLLTEAWLPKLVWFLMPSRRPMDNVRTAWDSPQEDEFALCSLGSLSPYLRIAFPNEPEEYLDYLDLQALTPAELESWQSRLRIFLQSLTLSTSKRLILKSPTHTARIAVLARMFPGAKFLHIVRNPLAIFPSTINLWQVLDEAQGLQLPHHRGLRSYVFRAFERMYRAFDQQRTQIAPSQLYELRYEDLVRDPISTLRQAYAALELGEFDAVQPKLAVMTAAQSRYQTNRFELPAEESAEILARWQSYAERYGYAESSAKAAAGGVR